MCYQSKKFSLSGRLLNLSKSLLGGHTKTRRAENLRTLIVNLFDTIYPMKVFLEKVKRLWSFMQMYFYVILIQSVGYNALFIQKLDCPVVLCWSSIITQKLAALGP